MQFDIKLIERLLQHDDLAFATFYEQTVSVFFRYIKTHYSLSDAEAHDIISDVYIKIRDNIWKYDESYTFWQFVRTILKNHCKDYFKKKKPLFFSDLVDIHGNDIIDTHAKSTLHDDDLSLQSFFEHEFTFEYIQKAIDLLEQEDQELLHARYVLYYSYDIIADLFWLKSDAVRQRVSRIIKKLRKNLSFLS